MSKQDEKGITWTDETWNPLRGCSKVSQGCANCYAESAAASARLAAPGKAYEGLTRDGKWTGEVILVEDKLTEPLRWKKPRRIFVNSMSDLFHESVPDEWIDEIFAVMALCPQHTFQVLTKRPGRMLEWFSSCEDRVRDAGNELFMALPENPGIRIEKAIDEHGAPWPLPHVWLGVSVEDQKTADERILLLLETPAAVRFVSAEPLLGPVDLSSFMWPVHNRWPATFRSAAEALAAGAEVTRHRQALVAASSVFVDWVIVGGESGPGARPMHPDWARSLRDQCQEAGVPFHFKQWGEFLPLLGHREFMDLPERQRDWVRIESAGVVEAMVPVGKKLAGRLLDGRIWDEFPEVKS